MKIYVHLHTYFMILIWKWEYWSRQQWLTLLSTLVCKKFSFFITQVCIINTAMFVLLELIALVIRGLPLLLRALLTPMNFYCSIWFLITLLNHLKVRILEQSSANLMNNGVQHRHCHTLVLGQHRNGSAKGPRSTSTGSCNMAVGPPYLHHTFSRRQHQLQQHYWYYNSSII